MLSSTKYLPRYRFFFLPQKPSADPDFDSAPVALIRHVPLTTAPRQSEEEPDVILYEYAVYVNKAAEQLTGINPAHYRYPISL